MCFDRMALGIAVAVMAGCAGCTSEADRVVARVAGHEITAAQFAARYSAYLTSTGARDNILIRKQVLDNMVSERLILDDFAAKGLDRDPWFLRRIAEVRQQALLDRFARRISLDTVTVSEDELAEEFRASLTRVDARYLYAATEEGARTLKRRLESGETFMSLAHEVFTDPGLANNGGHLGTFGWGEMDPELERAAFQTPVGAVSDPVRLPYGWAIVKVEHRIRQPLASESDFAAHKEKLRRVVVQRKVDRLVAQAAHGTAAGLNAAFNDSAVGILFQNKAWLEPAPPGEERPDVFTADVRSMPMVTFGDRRWTVGDFLEKSAWLTDRQRRHVRSREDIQSAAIGLATRDQLLERARAEGLEDDPDVLAQIERMDLEIRLKRWAATVEDTVGRGGWPEPVVRALYDSLSSELAVPPQVRVSEVLLRSKSEADEVVRRVRAGAAFSDLARERSIRRWAAREGGDLGWGTESTFGVLGKRFLASNTGDVIGPEFVDPYYGVFRITGRREGRPLGFDEARPWLEERLANAAKPRRVREAIGALRKDVPVSTDIEVLGNIVVSQEHTPKDHTP